jgi:hypothetical protein
MEERIEHITININNMKNDIKILQQEIIDKEKVNFAQVQMLNDNNIKNNILNK